MAVKVRHHITRLMVSSSGRPVCDAWSASSAVSRSSCHRRRWRVRWGVDRYPQGADWAKGVYRVPIAVMVSFGEDKMASGSLWIPNAPYFLSVFLGAHEQEGRAYTARYYQQGGRYFCQPCGVPPGQTVVTEFDLATHFTEQFQQ